MSEPIITTDSTITIGAEIKLYDTQRKEVHATTIQLPESAHIDTPRYVQWRGKLYERSAHFKFTAYIEIAPPMVHVLPDGEEKST